jgi:hypothetical protein
MDRVKASMAGNSFLQELLEQIEDLAENYLGGSAEPNSLKWRQPIIGIVRVLSGGVAILIIKISP